MQTQPLDDRDVAPWAEVEDDGSHKDVEAYQAEREAEQLEAYFVPSEPY
jgi:hypothetical protein